MCSSQTITSTDELREAKIEKKFKRFNSPRRPRWIADFGLRISDCGFRIADFGLRISDCGFRIVLIKNVFISPKSEIRNRQSAIKGHSVVKLGVPGSSRSDPTAASYPRLPRVTSTVVLPTVLSYFLV